ncbi:hypothetical protein RHSP_83542 [Rhizobium freirei PRF 81]|uniref:Uncharacterized protein n=1 Tax=Rhizobium freirei PRF 81 TaxID=363754 RepID=N6UYF4_9HYPH|nr:hypothetical protein RTCIAT899_PB00465 [Rhizobium tropici CIAT 899]ENN86695.1 hypothetical protein RHSP_83542 [Rhizobium freirei PRF 81]
MRDISSIRIACNRRGLLETTPMSAATIRKMKPALRHLAGSDGHATRKPQGRVAELGNLPALVVRAREMRLVYSISCIRSN